MLLLLALFPGRGSALSVLTRQRLDFTFARRLLDFTFCLGQRRCRRLLTRMCLGPVQPCVQVWQTSSHFTGWTPQAEFFSEAHPSGNRIAESPAPFAFDVEEDGLNRGLNPVACDQGAHGGEPLWPSTMREIFNEPLYSFQVHASLYVAACLR